VDNVKIRERTHCYNIENLAADDDDAPLFIANEALTMKSVGCSYIGDGDTVATISLEDSDGNAVTHTTPTCTAHGTDATWQAITASGALVTGELLRFDVDNAVDPETDTYTICIVYTIDEE